MDSIGEAPNPYTDSVQSWKLGRTSVRSNISKVVRLCVAEKRGVIYVSAGLMVDCLASHIFFPNSIKKHASHIFFQF